jgi:apolipoprotein N-acyltransferase
MVFMEQLVERRSGKIALTVVSAGLGILVFEPFAWWPLALVAWIPLLAVLRSASPREGFYLGLLHGFLLFGGTLSWVWSIFGRVSIGLWGILALFTAFSSLIVVLMPKRSPAVSALLVATVWAGVEFFRSELFTLAFPWVTPGTGLPPNWFTPIVGVYGISLLVFFGNALIFSHQKTGAALLLTLGIGVMTFFKSADPEKVVRVLLVQDETAIVSKMRDASEPLVEEVDAVVWPEYSLSDFDDDDLTAALALAGNRRVFVASGMETRKGETGNTAFTISKDGVVGRHIKNHPVHFFSDGIKGQTADPVETMHGKAGTPICFDCDHQDVIRKMTANGAEYFLIPSMDAMSWSARQHEQHGALFQHRAAENGRWLAVASTSGVTQFIDPHGQVRSRLPLMDEGTLVGEVGRLENRTVFQWGGWLIGPMALSATALVVLWLGWRRFSKSS